LATGASLMPDDRIGIDDRTSAATAGGDKQASQTSMVRLAIASCIGTTIELADFGLFALAAVLVFPHIFFPALGEAAGMTASLATFGVAFVARPLGSIIFGHIGDRLGRKGTLITTLTVMGVSTALVGVIPPASQIGVAAPIILVVLRFVQGLASVGSGPGRC
jgi:MFS family permease